MTSHQFARSLLAMPDLPIAHFDPSYSDACDEENDYTLGEPRAEINNPLDGLTLEEVLDMQSRGFSIDNFITICGDQPPAKDRKEVEGGAL